MTTNRGGLPSKIALLMVVLGLLLIGSLLQRALIQPGIAWKTPPQINSAPG